MRLTGDIGRVVALAAAMSLLTACGGTPECDTEGRYQLSQGGERIDVPNDLDELQSYKEMTIPEASPRASGNDTNPCLEMPPPISSGSSR